MSMRSFRYFLPFLCLTSGSFTSFFPSRSFRYLLPLSILTSGSFTSSFRFEPFISLYFFPLVFYSLTSPSFTSFPFSVCISSRPSFRCNSTLQFVTSFLSFQLFWIRFVTSFPFVSTLRFCPLYLVPFVLNSSLPFVTSFPSFQRFHPVHLPLPFISMRSFRYFHSFRFNVSNPFVYLFLSFQAVHSVTSFLSLQLFFPVRLALPYLPFLTAGPFHCVRLFVAPLPFHSLLPSFRFNSFSSRSLLLPFPFNSSLPFPIYSVPFASTLLFRPLLPPHRFNASILFI